MSTLLLIRHGGTLWNSAGRIQGRRPIPLGQDGRNQVAAIAPLVEAWSPQILYTSPIKRAFDSAAVLGRKLNLRLYKSSALAEWDVGRWAGRTSKELARTAQWQLYLTDPAAAMPPGGEPMPIFQKRVVTAMDRIIARAWPAAVLVTHGDVIRVALCYYLGLPLSHLHRLKVCPGSLSVLHVGKHQTQLIKLNVFPFQRSTVASACEF